MWRWLPGRGACAHRNPLGESGTRGCVHLSGGGPSPWSLPPPGSSLCSELLKSVAQSPGPQFPRPCSHPHGAPLLFPWAPLQCPIPSALCDPPPSPRSHRLHPSLASLRSSDASLPPQLHPPPQAGTLRPQPAGPGGQPPSQPLWPQPLPWGPSLGARSEPLHAPSCWPSPSSSSIHLPAPACTAERPREQGSKMGQRPAAAQGSTISTDVDLLQGNL